MKDRPDVTKLHRDNVAIVLVEPRAAGNIGSVARAMVNMGFSDLRLANPQVDHLNEEARWMAHGCADFLEKARVFPDFAGAVSDCGLVVATSHKSVRNSQRCVSSRDLAEAIAPYCLNNKVAIVFGRENHGLSNEEVNLCAWTVTIPAASWYPSLNLAQSVMVVCYELFVAEVPGEARELPCFVGNDAMEAFYAQLLKMLDGSGFRHKNERKEVFVGALRRIFSRTGLEERDLKVLYKLFSQFETPSAK